MKILGIVFLVLGILALIGGLSNPPSGDSSVIALGYLFKFGMIIVGIILISKNSKKNSIGIKY